MAGRLTDAHLGLGRPAPRMPGGAAAARRGGGLSAAAHVLIAAALLFVSTRPGSDGPIPQHPTPTRLVLPHMVFVATPGPPSGGGGGGRRDAEPASRARARARDLATLPATPPVIEVDQPSETFPHHDAIVIDEPALAADEQVVDGLPNAPAAVLSSGSGTGGGVGSGTGTGDGAGNGQGLGTGSGGGFGGGVYSSGGTVRPPTILRQVSPKYTVRAAERRVQGTVTLEAVIGRDGVPRTLRVMRSLDPDLDEEAMAAARQWRFAPGRIGNTPVDVLVTILLDFRLH